MSPQTETVKCNFCMSDNYSIKYQKEGFNIVQCKNCGLVYVNPRLTAQAITELYNDDYFTGRGFDRSVQYEQEFLLKRDTNDLSDWDVSTIKSMIVDHSNEKKRLLDIGSGMGLFLWKAKRQGFDVKGLELSSFAVGFSQSAGLDVENNSVYTANLAKDYYHSISMKEVIEHLPDPKQALDIIFNSLKKGGVLFMTTGNYNCIERRLKGANWFYFMPKGHIYIFTPATINKYLKQAGFSKIIITNQGDLLMNFLLKFFVIETDKFVPINIFKYIAFKLVRFINHFISSGLRIYAIK